MTAFNVIGRPMGDLPFTGSAGICQISYGYFNTLEIPLRRGRILTKGDNATAPHIVVINDAMARQCWPNGDPLQDRIQIDLGLRPAYPVEGPRQVIGIVGDTHDGGPNSDATPMMYVPLAQIPDQQTKLASLTRPLSWFVRSRMYPRTLIPSMSIPTSARVTPWRITMLRRLKA